MITVAGLSPSLDLTYLVESLQLGHIHRPTSVVRCAGGKSLNMARAAATIGAPSAVVAILGGQTGSWLGSALDQAGIEVVVVDSPNETRTCISIASTDTGQLTEVYENAAAIPDAVWRQFLAEIEATLSLRPGWLAISGGAPLGLEPSAIADLVRLGGRMGVRVAVDTHSSALPQAVEAHPALVKINRYEAADLLGVPPEGDLHAMAEAIRAISAGIVVLTDGSAGSIGVDGSVVLRAQMPNVLGTFPVGSGDSYLGGLMARLDAGADLAESMRTAAACGLANALVPGPGQFEQATVDELMQQVRISDLSGEDS